MAKRIFEKGSITMAGQRIGAFTLRCSHPLCRNSVDITDRNPIEKCSATSLRLRFERKGWFVGSNISDDLCPDHAKTALEERRARRRPHATNLKLVTAQGEPEIMHTEAPRVMSRDDKRIINVKLHDVYIGEREGYQTPWTDKKVAEDLGVPVAWVAEIREDLFGPAADNSEVREFLDKANEAKDQATKILNDASAAIINAKLMTTGIKAIEDKIGEMRRLLEVMNHTAERIRKAVTP